MSQPSLSVMAVNVGSSSIKFSLFALSPKINRVYEGEIERIGLSDSKFTLRSHSETLSHSVEATNNASAVNILMEWVNQMGISEHLSAVGHRIVHGGSKHFNPERVTPEMLTDLRHLSPFDPEHLPGEILLAEAFLRQFPDVIQVACFDTAFHRSLPRVARILPVPRKYENEGIRRFGFHGLSYESILQEMAKRSGIDSTKKRIILAHLGSSVSIAAVNDGKAFDTSTGFSPASGAAMGVCSGDIDPGFVWYLGRNELLSSKEINDLLTLKSGLLGISDISSDMRDLLALEETNSQAREAVSFFTYQIRKWIGGFIAAMGGIDSLVFSGGIGERSASVRGRICDGLQCVDIHLDTDRNQRSIPIISKGNSRVPIHIIHTDEELVIAKMVCDVLSLGWVA
ncbi:unnamed protein product [Sphagnum jensenii]|uniref:Probable acetate kinase n=1 Tax=Sphagnum jensenii TaxID=128206 RepID=A0ABP0VEI1_9BRYO